MFVLPGLCAIAALGRAAVVERSAPPPARAFVTQVLIDVRRTDTLRLTRARAIEVALARNPQLEIAREQTAQARARRVQGTSIPDPALAASYDQQSRLFELGAAGARPVSLGIAVPFPDKFRLNNRIGTADIQNYESNFRLQQQIVAVQTSAAYDSLLVSLRHRADLQVGLQLANDFARRTQARYDAGTAAKLDVIRARVDVAQAQNDLIASERDVAAAEASLNRQIGNAISAPIAPADTLAMPDVLPDSSDIERTALANRGELAMVESQRRGAAASTALAREFWLPDLTMSVSHDYTQPGSPVFSTGIALPVPVFYWQHARGEVAASAHLERQLAATYRDVQAQVTQDVRLAYANASTAMRQAVFLRDELVPAASEAYRVASTSYSLGGSSALEVLDARRALLDAQNQLAQALGAANTARADLVRALGLPLPRPGARP